MKEIFLDSHGGLWERESDTDQSLHTYRVLYMPPGYAENYLDSVSKHELVPEEFLIQNLGPIHRLDVGDRIKAAEPTYEVGSMMSLQKQAIVEMIEPRYISVLSDKPANSIAKTEYVCRVVDMTNDTATFKLEVRVSRDAFEHCLAVHNWTRVT